MSKFEVGDEVTFTYGDQKAEVVYCGGDIGDRGQEYAVEVEDGELFVVFEDNIKFDKPIVFNGKGLTVDQAVNRIKQHIEADCSPRHLMLELNYDVSHYMLGQRLLGGYNFYDINKNPLINTNEKLGLKDLLEELDKDVEFELKTVDVIEVAKIFYNKGEDR